MKMFRNLILNSLLVIIITLIILVSADIISVELLKNPDLHQVFQLVLSFVLIFILSKRNLSTYGFRLPDRFSYIKIILWIIIIQILISIPFLFYTIQEGAHPLSNSSLSEIVLKAWILAPLAEELLTRGLAQSFLSPYKHIGIKIKGVYFSYPVIFTASLFSLMHLPPIIRGEDIVVGISILVGAFCFGIVFGYVREISKSILPAIAGHMLANILATIIDFLLV